MAASTASQMSLGETFVLACGVITATFFFTLVLTLTTPGTVYSFRAIFFAHVSQCMFLTNTAVARVFFAPHTGADDSVAAAIPSRNVRRFDRIAGSFHSYHRDSGPCESLSVKLAISLRFESVVSCCRAMPAFVTPASDNTF